MVEGTPTPPATAASGPTPAGWYADPYGGPDLRYWDGATWTSYVHQQRPPTPPAPGPVAGYVTSWRTRTAGSWQGRGDVELAVNPRGLRFLSGWVQGLLWAGVATSGMTALLAAAATTTHLEFVGGRGRFADVARAEGSMFGGFTTHYLVLFVTAVLWIVWLYRTHRQVSAVTGQWGRYSRAWTIAGWLVPIANLWVPRRVHADLDALAVGASRRPSTALVNWWWALWLAANVIRTVMAPREVGTTALTFTYGLGVLWGLVSASAAICGVVMIRRITADVDRAAESAGLVS